VSVWNQKLYIGEYSGISSLKLNNSGIYVELKVRAFMDILYSISEVLGRIFYSPSIDLKVSVSQL
jgi:hypothetical protein